MKQNYLEDKDSKTLLDKYYNSLYVLNEGMRSVELDYTKLRGNDIEYNKYIASLDLPSRMRIASAVKNAIEITMQTVLAEPNEKVVKYLYNQVKDMEN